VREYNDTAHTGVDTDLSYGRIGMQTDVGTELGRIMSNQETDFSTVLPRAGSTYSVGMSILGTDDEARRAFGSVVDDAIRSTPRAVRVPFEIVPDEMLLSFWLRTRRMVVQVSVTCRVRIIHWGKRGLNSGTHPTTPVTLPPQRPTASPPHHLTTSPPHHLTTSPLHYSLLSSTAT
jgi:hypothetical protein